MTSSPDRGTAIQDQVIGSLKQGLGATANTLGIKNDLEAEGDRQKNQGDMEYKAKQGEEKAEGKKDNIVGKIQENVGGVFSEKQEREGKEKQLKGEALEEKSKH